MLFFMSIDVSLDLRLRAINLYVYSILLYCNQTWTLYVESTNKLEALEMCIFKCLARVNYEDRMTKEHTSCSILVALQDMTDNSPHR